MHLSERRGLEKVPGHRQGGLLVTFPPSRDLQLSRGGGVEVEDLDSEEGEEVPDVGSERARLGVEERETLLPLAPLGVADRVQDGRDGGPGGLLPVEVDEEEELEEGLLFDDSLVPGRNSARLRLCIKAEIESPASRT